MCSELAPATPARCSGQHADLALTCGACASSTALFLIVMCPARAWPPCLPFQGNLTTRGMATCLMAVARGWRAAPRWLQIATNWPIKKLSGALLDSCPGN